MADNIASIRQMSQALMDAAVSVEFREKLSAEVEGLLLSFDDVAVRSRLHNERVSSTQQRVETVLGDIQQVDSGIDEIMTRLMQLDIAGSDQDSISKQLSEFKVSFWTARSSVIQKLLENS